MLATVVVAAIRFTSGLAGVLGAAASVVSAMAAVAAVIGVFVPEGAARNCLSRPGGWWLVVASFGLFRT